MADKEPVGLDMSLDDLINKSNDYPKFKRKVGHDMSDGSKKEFRCFNCDTVFVTSADLYNHKDGKCIGKKMYQCFLCKEIFSTSTDLYQHKASGCSSTDKRKIVCYTCRNGGILTDFKSMEELHEHRNAMHSSYPNQNSRVPQVETVTVNYIWSGEGTNDEALCIEHLEIWLIRIYSSGDVHVNGNINHSISLFTILNTCLAPVNLKISLATDISGQWMIGSGGWIQPLENVKKVSAFTRRAWHIIRSKLDNLPVVIKLTASDQNSNTNTFKRQRQLPNNTNVSFQGRGHGPGFGMNNTIISPMIAPSSTSMDSMSMPFLGMPMQMPLMPMMMMQQMANMAQLQSMNNSTSTSNFQRNLNNINNFVGGESSLSSSGSGGINPFAPLPNNRSPFHLNPTMLHQGGIQQQSLSSGQVLQNVPQYRIPQQQQQQQQQQMQQPPLLQQQSQQYQGFSNRGGGRMGSYRGGRGRGRR